jgi:hypothetical protein
VEEICVGVGLVLIITIFTTCIAFKQEIINIIERLKR